MSKSLEFPAILAIATVAVGGTLAGYVAIATPEKPVAVEVPAEKPAVVAEISAPAAEAATTETVAETKVVEEPATAATATVTSAPQAEEVAPSTVLASGPRKLGRVALAEEIEAWDVAVLPDGTGLPEGSGSVEMGDEVFADKCSSCHGDFAEGLDSWPVLAGGEDTLTDMRPVKTIGSYWPYLSTVFDYVHRSMPFGAAQTVTADEAYAISAFLLYSNGLVEDEFVLSKENFTEVSLPNVDGFYPDDRAETEYPKFSAEPCMTNCAEGAVQVTKRAIDLNVTPEDPDGKPAGTMPAIFAKATAAEAVAANAGSEPAGDQAASAAGGDADLIAMGEKVFKKCAACHKVGDGAKNATGPIMNGVVGRAAGAVEGFKYSAPLMDMAAQGLVWDDANLHAFLENPKGFMKGTKMSFTGLKAEEERAAVIAFLASQSE